jgi:hypothetical protein
MACELCLREKPVTEHHLIPRTLHSTKWFEKNFTKAEMRSRLISLCEDCHTNIHKFHSEKELGKNFNTKEKLMADEKVANFVKWIAKRA